MIRTVSRRSILDRLLVFVVLVALLGLMQIANTSLSTSDLAARWVVDAVFVVGLLALSEIRSMPRLHGRQSRQLIAAIVIVALSTGSYAVSHSTLAAWLCVLALFVSLAFLDGIAGPILFRSRAGRWLYRLFLAGLGGFIPTILNQIESRFADEEFFVFVQGLGLVIFCLAFLLGQVYLWRTGGETEPRVEGQTRWKRLSVAGSLIGAVSGVGIWGVSAYQHSFFTPEAPAYPGVTEAAPFLCGQVFPAAGEPSGTDVYRRLLAATEANPTRDVPTLGMLTLETDDMQWAEGFREAVLAEARAGRFTEPANSVKYGQYEAAIRAYYVPLVQVKYPDLFSPDDRSLLMDWFAAINRRALTTEWVDWLYALAFSKQPEGPYENQENGAALLATLEANGLSPADLTPANQDYLRHNVRGWTQRFRNTDDSYLYQPEWIRNAYLQSLGEATTSVVERNQRLSFEWLLLQSLPDGAAFSYNRTGRRSIATEYYLGAYLLGDPRYVWLADRALDALQWQGGYPGVQPGLEGPVQLTGISPTEGSCLMYGDSGLPNQKGQLAPDKVVFRDGWSPASMYMLLNLRFTGWHRYKATNAAVALYQDGPLVVEQLNGQTLPWLPRGRAAFRDKRIPRENLNGLLIPQSGLSQVLQTLTGVGSVWAQDPPHYARVEVFESLKGVDMSRTLLEDWRGWTSARSIYFFHNGPVVVFDSAHKPDGASGASIVWHLIGSGRREDGSIWLREGVAPARVSLPINAWKTTSVQPEASDQEGADAWVLRYRSPEPGQLDLATTFLLNDWAWSEVTSTVVRDAKSSRSLGQYLSIRGPAGEIDVLHNESDGEINAHGISTKGRSVIVWVAPDEPVRVCYDGAGEFGLQAPSGVTRVRVDDLDLQRGLDWDLVGGVLRFHKTWSGEAGCASVE